LVANPRSLLAVRDRSSLNNGSLVLSNSLLEVTGLEIDELIRGFLRLHTSEILDVGVRQRDGVTNDRLQEGGLTTCCLTNDTHKLTFFHRDLHVFEVQLRLDGVLFLLLLLVDFGVLLVTI
jgi:hypothetical protein